MKLIHKIFLSVAICLSAGAVSAQTITDQIVIPEGYELADSIVYIHVSAVDTTLAGKDIINVMTAGSGDAAVDINQSPLVSESMKAHIQANKERTISGYRVRIFFDNKQSARNESEATLKKFKTSFPDIKAYRTYANPYFKVTVGDFRTKSEAMALLARIRRVFPSSFVVKENIEYPVVDSKNAIIVDTVKVLRPLTQNNQ